MFRYFLKTLRIHLKRGLSLYILTVFGVSLGVASVLAIQIINQSAISAFRGGLRAISGEADLSVQGLEPTLPEGLIAEVLGTQGINAAWPICEYEALTSSPEPMRLRVLGLDLLRPGSIQEMTDKDSFRDFLSIPGWMTISDQLAQERGWAEGSVVSATSGSRKVELVVGSILDFQRLSPQLSSRVVLMDIAQAQSLLGNRGRIHRIDIDLGKNISQKEAADRLRGRLGDAVQVLTPGEQIYQAEGLLAAFRLNLTALSLISLFVAVFLIYSSTQASLVRRRRELGLLRSLGATPYQTFMLILGEAVLLGVLGVLVGIPFGYWMAEASLETVNSTLTNIYLLDEIEQAQMPIWLVWLAIAIGVGSAFFGALLPALDASRKDTSALLAAFTLREKISGLAKPMLAVSVSILSITILLCWVKGFAWKPGGFLLGIALLIALPLAAPFTILQLCGRIKARDFGFRYSLKSLADRVQTTAFAVASLGIAITMLVGITLMVGSFRETVRVWVETTIAADLYITTRSWRGAGSSATLDSDLVQKIRSLPNVQAVDRIRAFPYRLDDRRVIFSGVDLSVPLSESRYPLQSGDRVEAFKKLRRGLGVLISEPLARKAGLEVGEDIQVYGKESSELLKICGIIHDYSSDSGLVVMSLKHMEGVFGQGEANSLALYLKPGANGEDVSQYLADEFRNLPLQITSNRELRENILEIFDQTFAVVRILQAISLLIAVSGITLTLLILARERISELAIYRALGAQRFQIFRIFLGKGISIALLSSILGFLGGIALAMILVFWINRAYFGWSIMLSFPWPDLSQEIVLILLTAALASIYPAMRASETPATELNRDDL